MATHSDFLKTLYKLIRDNAVEDDSGKPHILASQLGVLVGQEFGSTNPKIHGFPKLKDALDVLSEKKLITTSSIKAGPLDIWLNDEALDPDSVRFETSRPFISSPPPKFLERFVWRAVVFPHSEGHYYMNLLNGDVQPSRQGSPTKPGTWIKMPAASETEQKRWAREFIEAEGLDELSVVEEIQGAEWHTQFLKALENLGEKGASLVIRWKQFRTRHVIELVESWRAANGVEKAFVYQGLSEVSRSKESGDSEKEERLSIPRKTLLKMIGHLTSDELLEIRVPLRVVVKELGERMD